MAELYDLLILVDATFSMSNYLEALQKSLPKIISITQLTSCFSRLGLLVYRDYTEEDRLEDGMLEWSGWYTPEHPEQGISSDALRLFAQRLSPIGGGDYPEATKTGLAKAYELMRREATTIILMYTDAPPHIQVDGNGRDKCSNQSRERDNLTGKRSSSLFPVKNNAFSDWVSTATTLRYGEKKAHVLCFLDPSLGAFKAMAGYYYYLSAMTKGACFSVTRPNPTDIAHVTINVLLAWMGVEKPGAHSIELAAELTRYVVGASITKLKNETDEAANYYFWASGTKTSATTRIENNIAQVKVTSDLLQRYLPKKKTPVDNFANRYKVDEQYHKFATSQIEQLIQSDVTTIASNPVFGSLWRAVCNDRDNSKRDDLVNAFSREVERIAEQDVKAHMKAWLEDSYDYDQDIKDLMAQVPPDQQFPCVYFDPTLHYSGRDKDDRAINSFTRDELLEIGRSCDHRIVRRLGKVLTQLSYVSDADELPNHIVKGNTPRIPLILGHKDYQYKLYRILLHLVVGGTMLSARPSAVLAALVIKMGIQPLTRSAIDLMLFWKHKWANLEVPETWNTSCLGLLLDADNAYRDHDDQDVGLLQNKDRALFKGLVAYKLAEANLETTLTARVGWTPDKSKIPIGPIVTCSSCHYPRSVTIMVPNSGGKCGLCVVSDYISIDDKNKSIASNVSKDHTPETEATWVECSDRSCRAQYVVYNAHRLNVRPKCHYCRKGSTKSEKAPWLECGTCLNRIIYPREFRLRTTQPIQCVLCSHRRQSIIDLETCAEKLRKENGTGWLLKNAHNVLQEPFTKRTLFHTISTTGVDSFLQNVTVLPFDGNPPHLTVKGKLIHNTTEVFNQLQTWIDRRCAEVFSCTLCFSDFHPSRLRDACGRKGCNQRICETCLNSWYGTNSVGHVINPATLHCPFCRRPPAAKTLAAYGMGIHALGNLKQAVEERGSWIYAWCMSCSRAKRYLERSCARGAPTVDSFNCEECIDTELERLRLEEENARVVLEIAERADAEEAYVARQRVADALLNRLRHEKEVKKCPGCSILCQKIDGCDHITCPKCLTHWCWSCKEEFTADTIYLHLSNEHGGYYDGE